MMHHNNQENKQKLDNNINVVTLADVCIIRFGEETFEKDTVQNGQYPVIGHIEYQDLFEKSHSNYSSHESYNQRINKYNCEANSLLISGIDNEFSELVKLRKFNESIWMSANCASIVSKNEQILNNNYLHYWLEHVKRHIKLNNITKILIPVLPIEQQIQIGNQFIEHLNYVIMCNEQIKHLNQEIFNSRMMQQTRFSKMRIYTHNTIDDLPYLL